MNIVKNFIYNFLYQLLTIIMPIITVPYVSRVLGADGIGKNAYTNAYVQYFILLGLIGLSMYSNRQIAYVRDNEIKLNTTFWELNILRFITMSISLFFYIIIFLVINKNDRLIYLIQGLNLLASAVDISWFFMGIEDFKKTVTRNTFTKIVGVVLIFLLVKEKEHVWIYILILSLSQFLGQLFMWLQLPKFIHITKIDSKKLIRHLKYSVRLFIPQIAIQVYTLLDRTMLGWIIGETEVGIYDNSQKIIKIILTLLTSLSTVMMPYMANAFANKNMNKFKQSIMNSFSFTSFMSIPMAFGLVGIAHNFVPWFYGKEFSHIEYLIYVGAWVMIPIAWSSVLGVQIMIPMKKEYEYSKSVAIAAVINFCFNIILIPKLQSTGTTISTVIAEYFGTIIQLYLLRNFIEIKCLFKGIYKCIIASALMFIMIRYLDKMLSPNMMSTFIESIVGIIVYLVIMLLARDTNLVSLIKKISNYKKLKKINF